MARTAPRPLPDREQVLKTVHRSCPACGRRLRYRYDNRHTVTTLAGLVRLHLQIRRCENPACVRHYRPYRPEAEGALVLPQHEFGLDVIALIGALRYREHRRGPQAIRIAWGGRRQRTTPSRAGSGPCSTSLSSSASCSGVSRGFGPA